MANYILQEMNDVRKSGERKVYPKMVINQMIDTDGLVEKMRLYNRTFSSSTVKGVLQDVADMMAELMSLGHSVKLDGIGYFSPSLGFEDDKPNSMQSDEDKMLYRKVSVKDINFKADAKFVKETKKRTSLSRVASNVKTLSKSRYSLEEHIQRALDIIRKNGYITLTEYANINDISRPSASKELKKLTADEDCPIIHRGDGSHKIWVERK